MDPVDEIKRLYYETTRATIARDLARAVELLKSLPSEEARERAAAFMDGLSQMRSEWGVRGGDTSNAPGPRGHRRAGGRPKKPAR
ncbi:MAG: hypothetical protein KGN76_16420 [Acidobacteriota bacterium]|nr:hypothetical protein [Acidobacteriota bacterium]